MHSLSFKILLLVAVLGFLVVAGYDQYRRTQEHRAQLLKFCYQSIIETDRTRTELSAGRFGFVFTERSAALFTNPNADDFQELFTISRPNRGCP